MEQKRIFALGFFDGVHLGHQALLAECIRLAGEMNCGTGAITFDRHPQTLFTPEPPPLINSAHDRQWLLQMYGMEHILVLPVNKAVMSTPWREFLEQLLEWGAAGFVCGDDFRFGARGEGNVEKLETFCAERNLPCVIVPEQTVEGIRVSSTCIRGLLEQGRMEKALQYLGHPHILTGTVVPGRHLGRTIGIPTANILIPDGVAVPKLGVYACRAMLDGKWYAAVTNVGRRPTVEGHQVRTESWILDFEGDLYGKTIMLEFHKFLRPEIKFPSLAELQAEIQKNAWETRKFFDP